jgi:hypothetical protein
MIPNEVEPSILQLPKSDDCRIVVITSGELRHDRFALRLQAEFPGLVVAWLRVTPRSARPSATATSRLHQFRRLRATLVGLVDSRPEMLWSRNGRRLVIERSRALLSRVGRRMLARLRHEASQRIIEERMFGAEIEQLRKTAYVSPTPVGDPNSPETINYIKSLKPYFILTLAGAIYGKELRDCARGLALNQHDGWCPEYRGADTVDWALYHRDLTKVANTVHILTSGMDSGPIVRRSTVCLASDDSLESCLARSVAVGTELMCETVREVIETKQARIFDQPQFTGYTYLQSHMTKEIRDEIRRDIRHGLITRHIAATRAAL